MEYRVGDRLIRISLPDEPFAVWLSGGFDSTLLLHLLCREKPTTLMAFNVARGGGTERHAHLVATSVGARYGVDVCLTEIEPVGRDAHAEINGPMEAFLRDGFVRHIFTGVTSNPSSLPGGPLRPTVEVQGYILPFLHCDKSHTVALADQLGLLEDISMLSHTCTERGSPEERCGLCWQCRERAWAFGVNRLDDPREAALR